jgi:hypothetical protein
MRAWLTVWAWTFGIALTALALTAQPARADDDGDDDGDSWARFMLGIDLDYVYAIDEQSIESGGGAALRVGSELDLILITLIPELYLSHHELDVMDASLTTGKLGGRIRIGKILEPGLYAHVGIASASAGGPSYTAPAFDIGFTLDFTLLPFIDIGAHAAYNSVFPTDDYDAFRYAIFGLHAALVI